MSPRHKLINIGFSQTIFFFSPFKKCKRLTSPGSTGFSSWMLYKTSEIGRNLGSFDLTLSVLHLIRFKWFDRDVVRGPSGNHLPVCFSALTWQTGSKQNQVSIYPSSIFLFLNNNNNNNNNNKWSKLKSWSLETWLLFCEPPNLQGL